MNPRERLIAALTITVSAVVVSARAATPLPDAPSIEYTVAAPNLVKERFIVTAVLNGISADTLTFRLPMWAPGAYDRVNFGRWVREFGANSADGTALTVIRADSNSWRVVGVRPGTRLRYVVQDIEALPNAAWFGLSDVEESFAFANGTALFGYPVDVGRVRYSVAYELPPGWSLSVALTPADSSGLRFLARDYDELADSPVHMGPFRRMSFEVNGKPHVLSITAMGSIGDTAAARLLEGTRRTVEAVSQFFGDMPYDRYHFQQFLIDPRRRGFRLTSFGALEHAASSTYLMIWLDDESGLAMLLPVIAHEYIHAWNPKRFHSSRLGPFDYQRDPQTSSLWFVEGLTEYYARVIPTRADLLPVSSFFAEFEATIAATRGTARRESLTALSRRLMDADHRDIAGVYTVGPLVGLLLDLEIRRQTENRASLDNAMRHFNEAYGRTGQAFNDEDILPIIERSTGTHLAEFYDRYIDGVDPLPVDSLLRSGGLRWVDKDSVVASLGAAITLSDDTFYIEAIDSGGTAHASGLRDGDQLVELTTNDGSVPPSYLFEHRIEGRTLFEAGMVRALTVRRNGSLTAVPLTYVGTTTRVRRLEPDPAASPMAREIRTGLLGK